MWAAAAVVALFLLLAFPKQFGVLLLACVFGIGVFLWSGAQESKRREQELSGYPVFHVDLT